MDKKILWLTSWYPNRTDGFTGDFIQRHAQAASLFCHILVLHVTRAARPFFPGNVHEETSTQGNLTEHIVYFRCDIPWAPLNRLVSFFKYRSLSGRYARRYLKGPSPPVFAHVHVPLKAGLTALRLKKTNQLPYILTDHYGIYNDWVDEPFLSRSWLFRRMVSKVVRAADYFVPVSKYLGEAVNDQVTTKPFTVIYNTVDTRFFHFTGNPGGKFRFIHVSNMAPLKNVKGIIRAVANLRPEYPQIELQIVGLISPEVYDFAVDTGLVDQAIFFTGEVTYPEVAEEMKRSQAFVLFSRTENMPCVVLEALCCGLPVISSRAGGVAEVVDDSNGILVKPGDVAALTEALGTMISSYRQFDRAKISEAAIQRFDYPTIGKKITEVYEKMFSHLSC